MNKPIQVPEIEGHRPFKVLNRSFQAETRKDELELTIYDEIGFFGTSAAKIRAQLDANKKVKQITLNLNSPGGDVFDGIAIFNDLLNHPAKVVVRVNGLAASAASVIAMAGDKVIMAKNAFMMIHNVWAVVIGGKAEMMHMADVIGQLDEALVRTYAERSGQSQRSVRAAMEAETWMAADEALDLGYSDETMDNEAAVNALFDLSGYNNVPTKVKRDIEGSLRDAGYSQREAKTAVSSGFDSLRRDDATDLQHRDGEGDEDDGSSAEILALLAKGAEILST